MNIVALDLDDCILPTDINYFGRTDDSLRIFEINLVRLVMILDKYDMKVFITSSWAHLLKMEVKELVLDSPRDDITTLMGFALLKKYLEKYIVGLSDGDRTQDIQEMQSEGHKIVILDDWDLKELEDSNTLYVRMGGFIDGNVGFLIHKFMTENKKVKRHEN